VIVRNEIGCELLTDIEVPAIPFHAFGSITMTTATCGESDGVVALVPDGAVADYSFDGMAVIPDGVYRDLATGSYDLIYTDTSGCIREQLVLVSEAECGIYIPNVFSPNGDGINDVFSPFYAEDRYTLESFRIFDRWGSTILDCTNPCSWDGSAGSQDAGPGVYLYVLILKPMEGELFRMSGDVTLIR